MKTKAQLKKMRADVEKRIKAHYEENYNDTFTLKDMRAWSEQNQPLLAELADIEAQEAEWFWKDWYAGIEQEAKDYREKWEAEEAAIVAERQRKREVAMAEEAKRRAAWQKALNDKRKQLKKPTVDYAKH